MTRKDVERAERFFGGRGAWSVAVARVVPLVRAFVGLVAGFMEVPVLQFEIFNVIGTAVWATALSVIGYELGSDWGKVSKNFSHASDGLAGLVVLMLVVLIAVKAREVRKERREDIAAGLPGSAAEHPAGRTARPGTAPARTARVADQPHRARIAGPDGRRACVAPHCGRLPGLPAQLR